MFGCLSVAPASGDKEHSLKLKHSHFLKWLQKEICSLETKHFQAHNPPRTAVYILNSKQINYKNILGTLFPTCPPLLYTSKQT